MGLLSFFGAGKEAGEAIASPIKAVGNALDNLFTSDEEREQAAVVKAKLAQQPHILQAEINKLEAQHRTRFVAGWRPYLGWILGTSIGMYYIPQFLMAAILWTKACWASGQLSPYPIENINGLKELIMGLLGLGGMRMLEKMKRVAK